LRCLPSKLISRHKPTLGDISFITAYYNEKKIRERDAYERAKREAESKRRRR